MEFTNLLVVMVLVVTVSRLTGVNSTDTEECSSTACPGTAKPDLTKPMKVAFTVALDENVGPMAAPLTLKCRRITTNIGNGYNTETGLFTAPVPGTYIFNYHVLSQHDRVMEVWLMKNDELINSVFSWQTNGFSGASNSAILNLQTGDTALLRLNKDKSITGTNVVWYTTFSGYLLYAE